MNAESTFACLPQTSIWVDVHLSLLDFYEGGNSEKTEQGLYYAISRTLRIWNENSQGSPLLDFLCEVRANLPELSRKDIQGNILDLRGSYGESGLFPRSIHLLHFSIASSSVRSGPQRTPASPAVGSGRLHAVQAI